MSALHRSRKHLGLTESRLLSFSAGLEFIEGDTAPEAKGKSQSKESHEDNEAHYNASRAERKRNESLARFDEIPELERQEIEEAADKLVKEYDKFDQQELGRRFDEMRNLLAKARRQADDHLDDAFWTNDDGDYTGDPFWTHDKGDYTGDPFWIQNEKGDDSRINVKTARIRLRAIEKVRDLRKKAIEDVSSFIKGNADQPTEPVSPDLNAAKKGFEQLFRDPMTVNQLLTWYATDKDGFVVSEEQMRDVKRQVLKILNIPKPPDHVTMTVRADQNSITIDLEGTSPHAFSARVKAERSPSGNQDWAVRNLVLNPED